jgi:lipopolysaccharide/colanic/teichoic acid biosynthesis glycosyltransferase
MTTTQLSRLSPALITQTTPIPSSTPDYQFRFVFTFFNRSSTIPYKLQQGFKRGFDLLAAVFGILAISPLLLCIAGIIKLSSPGPILYKSTRIGKGYQPFPMFKFRTMGVDADSKREALRAAANLQGELFKLSNDPRITPVGKLLRALSLDELPQLLNVLRGEMSLVGPRPLPPDESALFATPYTLRFQVKPGITGLWQVSGRSQLSFEQLCKLEMSYVMNWSLFHDAKILLKTIPAVLLSRGAC